MRRNGYTVSVPLPEHVGRGERTGPKKLFLDEGIPPENVADRKTSKGPRKPPEELPRGPISPTPAAAPVGAFVRRHWGHIEERVVGNRPSRAYLRFYFGGRLALRLPDNVARGDDSPGDPTLDNRRHVNIVEDHQSAASEDVPLELAVLAENAGEGEKEKARKR